MLTGRASGLISLLNSNHDSANQEAGNRKQEANSAQEKVEYKIGKKVTRELQFG